MFCRKCGVEVSAGARFCAKCGTKVIDAPRVEELFDRSSQTILTHSGYAKGVGGASIQMVEGVFSVFLAVSVLFAPVVRVIYDTGYSTSSMLHVALNLSRFRFPGKYAPIGPVLSILMLLAFVGSLLNAKQAFSSEPMKYKIIAGSIKVSNSYASMVTVYAIALIILLGVSRGNAFGIAGCSIWAWLLLFVGIVCQAVHFLRVSLSDTLVRKMVLR